MTYFSCDEKAYPSSRDRSFLKGPFVRCQLSGTEFIVFWAANPPKYATKQSGLFLATQEVGCGLKLFCPEPEAITAQRPRMFSLFGGVGVAEARRKKRRKKRPAILVAPSHPPSLLAPFSWLRPTKREAFGRGFEGPAMLLFIMSFETCWSKHACKKGTRARGRDFARAPREAPSNSWPSSSFFSWTYAIISKGSSILNENHVYL